MKYRLTTTLALLREHNACVDGYRKLRKNLGCAYDDDAPINLLTILASNGVADMLWCLCATVEDSRVPRLLIAADIAESVLPIWAARYPDDKRPAAAIQAARDLAHGRITTATAYAAAATTAATAAYAADAATDAATAAATATYAADAAAYAATAYAATAAADATAADATATAAAAEYAADAAAYAAAATAAAAYAATDAATADYADTDAATADYADTAYADADAKERGKQAAIIRKWLEE